MAVDHAANADDDDGEIESEPFFAHSLCPQALHSMCPGHSTLALAVPLQDFHTPNDADKAGGKEEEETEITEAMAEDDEEMAYEGVAPVLPPVGAAATAKAPRQLAERPQGTFVCEDLSEEESDFEGDELSD
jgi:hypothetical protein